MRSLLLVLALNTASPLLAVLPPQLAVRLDPETITVGDRVWATFEVTVDAANPPPVFPTLDQRWGKAEILSHEPVVREDAGSGRARYRQRFALTAFEPGSVLLPVVAVTVADGESSTAIRLSTPADLTLVVESVLPGESTAAPPPPRPPQPPRSLPLGTTFWWSLTGGVTLLGLVLLLTALRPRRPVDARQAVPGLPPWPELLAGLSQATAAATPEAAHVALSLALRRYLGRTLGFPALESTSREIGRQLESRLAGRRAPHGATARVRELLAACDGVKFARVAADPAVTTRRIAAARDIAGEIEAHLAPAPPPGAPLSGGQR